jgi:RNA polymerase sigma-70 factor, ECF subfamily
MEDALEYRAFATALESEQSDADLVREAKREVAAFGTLYERYYTRVYRYIYHRIGSAPDAEDITALVFMKALEALPSYQSRDRGFAPWLFRITRNAVVDHYRRGRRLTNLDETFEESARDDPVEDVLEGERRQELHALVGCLSPDQREVVLMRYAADLSFSEIAAALNKNEPAVRMLLHRGLRKLKGVIGDE